jgi:hypothetical protein
VAGSLFSHRCIYFSQPFSLGRIGKTGLKPITNRIKAALHATNPVEKPSIHQSSNGTAPD